MEKIRPFFKISILLCAGILGGVLAELFVIPALLRLPAPSYAGFLREFKARTTIVKETKEIIIDKSDVFVQSAYKVKAVLGSVERRSGGAVQSSSSAIIVTSDGWLVAPFSVVDGRGSFFVVRPGSTLPASLVRADRKAGLALLDIEDANMSAAEFSSFRDYELGEAVFALGALTRETIEDRFDAGYVSSLTASAVEFSPGFAASMPSGSGIFTAEGKLAAMAVKDGSLGKMFFIPVERIAEFIASKN